MITVRELIAGLQNYGPDAIVFFQIEEDGNEKRASIRVFEPPDWEYKDHINQPNDATLPPDSVTAVSFE